MIKLDKRLKRLVEKMAEDSFFAEGKLAEKKVEKYLQTLKSLPRPEAIVSLSEYLKLIKLGIAKTTLKIESAVPLSETQVEEITKSVRGRQPVLEVKTEIKGSLLGGLRIKIGDVVFDDSVAQRINQLKGVING